MALSRPHAGCSASPAAIAPARELFGSLHSVPIQALHQGQARTDALGPLVHRKPVRPRSPSQPTHLSPSSPHVPSPPQHEFGPTQGSSLPADHVSGCKLDPNIDRLDQHERVKYLEQLERAKSRIAQLETQLAEVLPFRVEPSSFELERLQSDNHQLTLQTFALARKLRDTVPSTRIEPEAASIELQQENRKLLADVHLLQSRLATSESQTSRLFEELRRLRPYYLQGSPLIVHDTEIDLLSGQTPKPGARAVLLGDAEAELLLHAGKTQSHVRRIQRISLEKALEDHSDAIAQVLATGPRARSEVDPDALQDSQSVSSNNTLPEQLASFHLPVPPLVAREQVPAQAGVSSFAGMSHHVVNPGLMDNRIPAQPILEPGSELLPSAAESRVASGSSASSHLDAPVAKRRRIEPSPDSGIWLPASVLPTAIPVSVDHSRAIHEPLLPRGRSVGRHSATHATTQIRGAKVSLPGKPVGRTPSALDLLSEAAGALRSDPDVVASADSDDVMQSRTDEASKALEVGSLSYNPRSRKPKLDANGEKKARSPYIKWNVEEDEQLLKAVIQCGCAWDAVAKLCPTRAYHQVRQRFLRGLRSGETLPPELMYLQVAVRQSVTEYESKRKRKKPARQLSNDPQGYQDPPIDSEHPSPEPDGLGLPGEEDFVEHDD